MTEQEFNNRLSEIEKQYSARREGAEAYRDQEVSRLFVECGWTQEAVGKRMGQSVSWVCRRLLLGRFLSFLTTGQKTTSLTNLTERRFRTVWQATHKDRHPKETEEERFGRVLALLAALPVIPKG